jgi:uncharacterized protein (TIGR00251 family)
VRLQAELRWLCAKKTAITGVYGEGAAAQLKIAVQAPPVEGRANSALMAFLAEMFGVPKKSVELVSGELSRSKVFLLWGVAAERAQAKLTEWYHPARAWKTHEQLPG